MSHWIRFALSLTGVAAALAAAGAGCNDVSLGGPATLVRVDPEPGGERCPEGGTAIHTGLDADDDLYLDDGEIASTQYVCNGAPKVACAGGTVIPGPIAVRDVAGWSALDGVHCVDGDLLIAGVPGDLPALPDLSIVTGDVVIAGNPGFSSLSGISHLRLVGGRLQVQGNEGLTHLTGLGAVERAEAIIVVGNDHLVDLAGLEQLVHFDSSLQISHNGALRSLAGLDHLISAQTLIVSANASLTSLDGLAALEHVVVFEVGGNAALTSMALGALQQVEVNLAITDNAALTSVLLPRVDSIGNAFRVRGNAALQRISARALVSAGNLEVAADNNLTEIDLPGLVYLTGPLQLAVLLPKAGEERTGKKGAGTV